MAEGRLKCDAAFKRRVIEEVAAGSEAVVFIARRWALTSNGSMPGARIGGVRRKWRRPSCRSHMQPILQGS